MPWQAKLRRLAPTALEQKQIHLLTTEILGGNEQIEIISALDSAAIYSQELPRPIRQAFHDFQLRQDHHALCIDLASLLKERLVRRRLATGRLGTQHATYYDVTHTFRCASW